MCLKSITSSTWPSACCMAAPRPTRLVSARMCTCARVCLCFCKEEHSCLACAPAPHVTHPPTPPPHPTHHPTLPFASERSLLSKLKTECGYQFTSKLVGACSLCLI